MTGAEDDAETTGEELSDEEAGLLDGTAPLDFGPDAEPLETGAEEDP